MELRMKQEVETIILDLNTMGEVEWTYDFEKGKVVEWDKEKEEQILGDETFIEKFNNDPIRYSAWCLTSWMSCEEDEKGRRNYIATFDVYTRDLIIEYWNEYIQGKDFNFENRSWVLPKLDKEGYYVN